MRKIEDLYDVYVGIVSGKDGIYKNDEIGNISVLNGMTVIDNINTLQIHKYVYTKIYPSDNKKIDKYLLSHKDTLIKRKIRKFNSNNWFEWGAPRNIKKMEECKDQDCIYVINITRKNIVAFKDKVQYFGGSLIMLKPKDNITEILNFEFDDILDRTLSYLNSNEFKKIFTYSNRFKIGHRQISKSFIDI
jgi:adenine-specific DNA-methyltransferase